MIKPAYSAQISTDYFPPLKFVFDILNDKEMFWMGIKGHPQGRESLLHINKLCDNSCQPPQRFDKGVDGLIWRMKPTYTINRRAFNGTRMLQVI